MQLIKAMILLATTAAAAALPYDDGTLAQRKQPTVYITEFTAEHVPHSVDNKVKFHLCDEYNNMTTDCEAGHATKYSNNLGEIRNGMCTNADYSFSLTKSQGWYTFYVNLPGAYAETAFPPSDVKYHFDHGFEWEYLNVTQFVAKGYST